MQSDSNFVINKHFIIDPCFQMDQQFSVVLSISTTRRSPSSCRGNERYFFPVSARVVYFSATCVQVIRRVIIISVVFASVDSRSNLDLCLVYYLRWLFRTWDWQPSQEGHHTSRKHFQKWLSQKYDGNQ